MERKAVEGEGEREQGEGRKGSLIKLAFGEGSGVSCIVTHVTPGVVVG
jgi:hypothetical protein